MAKNLHAKHYLGDLPTMADPWYIARVKQRMAEAIAREMMECGTIAFDKVEDVHGHRLRASVYLHLMHVASVENHPT